MFHMQVETASFAKFEGATRREKTEMGKRAEAALYRAGLFIQARSMEIVPVDTGATRASAYTRVIGRGLRARVIVGYGTSYAGIVHEDLNAAHGAVFNAKYAAQIAAGLTHARKPEEQAKFLERPIRQYRRNTAAIIREGMKRRTK